MSSDILIRLSTLETQLVHTNEKVKMREHVIEQLEEEIQAKEQLIYEQGHLIHILESENKFDEVSWHFSVENEQQYDVVNNGGLFTKENHCKKYVEKEIGA
ncbi:hypothetical protein Aduo_009650 [Ancylostoma duodenale]